MGSPCSKGGDHRPAAHDRFLQNDGTQSRVVRKMVANLEELLAANKVTLLCGTAKVVEPGTIVIETGEIIRCKNIVIATGSSSWTPPIPGAIYQAF